eukprot:TRINITY_DN18709_c0_g1_i1.p1 TRINITY_DN18709_c0_g1~~TRINITY_DN18709_c0_g1_i1.p1  ORF type:complete len:113 (-),score=32.63 TRINITY_DN18709_c0_g1_i1:78-416(-)
MCIRDRSMEDLKPMGMKMIELLNKDKEPLDEMKKVHQYIDMALSGEVSFQDEKTESYFYDGFLGGIAKAALNSYHFKNNEMIVLVKELCENCLLYTSPSPRDLSTSRMPSSA